MSLDKMSITGFSNKMTALKVCVIIPTYNNAKTLKRVIDGVLEYTKHVIIINDGSTDATEELLKKYSTLETLNISKNQGKGNALKTGFKKAEDLGYEYAITIDSDGQHLPEDIPTFINALEDSHEKNVLLIGARNMDQETVPKKSSFGNRFSNFWYWVETGIQLQDTQSGFRLYPLKEVNNLNLKTKKFEFEIEVIVKAAWKGTHVKNIPVKVLYNMEERVSHFRPFKDFSRISVLNTYFVFLTFFWVLPRKAIKKKISKGPRQFLIEDVLGHNDSPGKKASSVALGIFIGLSPLWGLHTITVLFLAFVLKLNKAIAFAFSNVSLPPFIPFIIFAGLQTGAMLLGVENSLAIEEMGISYDYSNHIITYLVGSVVFSLLMAGIAGVLTYMMLSTFHGKKNNSGA